MKRHITTQIARIIQKCQMTEIERGIVQAFMDPYWADNKLK